MHWNPNPIMLQIGPVTIMWYGFFFTVGLFTTVLLGHRIFPARGLEERHASNLTFWTCAGLFIGAHVFDLVFYNWQALVQNPASLLDPRAGLSSHGAAVGVIGSALIYVRLYKLPFHKVADAVIVAAVWLFPWVRLGNFFNSEVVGLPTDLPWGIIFDQTGLPEPRHPSQLYEVILCTSLIPLGTWLHRQRHRLRTGATFYLILTLYFSGRFLLEFAKERQAIAPSFPLNMGQLLSLPGVLICGAALWKLWPIFIEPKPQETKTPKQK